jgi:hypothetical protein
VPSKKVKVRWKCNVSLFICFIVHLFVKIPPMWLSLHAGIKRKKRSGVFLCESSLI